MQTYTEYWKIMVSSDSGVWGDYYLTNIFLLSKYIESVSKLFWSVAAICILHKVLATSYFTNEKTLIFLIYLFLFLIKEKKKIQMFSGLK